MKILKLKRKTIETHYEIDKELCDICGEEREEDLYDATDVKVCADIGSFYPEGDSRDTYEIDVCSDCFLEKIIPLIEKEFSIKFKEFPTDWSLRDKYLKNSKVL